MKIRIVTGMMAVSLIVAGLLFPGTVRAAGEQDEVWLTEERMDAGLDEELGGEGIRSGDWEYYTTDRGTALLAHYFGTQTNADLVIPDTIDGRTVDAMLTYALHINEKDEADRRASIQSIQNIWIPGGMGITKIAKDDYISMLEWEWVFRDCSSLTNIYVDGGSAYDGYNLQKRLREYRDLQLLFLRHPEIDYTNNISERLLRQFKRKQKQMTTFRSAQSAENICNTLGIIATGKAAGNSAYDSILNVFKR